MNKKRIDHQRIIRYTLVVLFAFLASACNQKFNTRKSRTLKPILTTLSTMYLLSNPVSSQCKQDQFIKFYDPTFKEDRTIIRGLCDKKIPILLLKNQDLHLWKYELPKGILLQDMYVNTLRKHIMTCGTIDNYQNGTNMDGFFQGFDLHTGEPIKELTTHKDFNNEKKDDFYRHCFSLDEGGMIFIGYSGNMKHKKKPKLTISKFDSTNHLQWSVKYEKYKVRFIHGEESSYDVKNKNLNLYNMIVVRNNQERILLTYDLSNGQLLRSQPIKKTYSILASLSGNKPGVELGHIVNNLYKFDKKVEFNLKTLLKRKTEL